MKFFSILVMSFLILGMAAPTVNSQEKTAPDFSLNDLDGNAVTLSELLGKNTILVVFGATWCPYCVQEIPELKELHKELGEKGLKILAVDIKESETKLKSFAKKHAIPYPTLLDKDGSVAQSYEVYGIPANFLIDKKGKIRSTGTIPSTALIKKVMAE